MIYGSFINDKIAIVLMKFKSNFLILNGSPHFLLHLEILLNFLRQNYWYIPISKILLNFDIYRVILNRKYSEKVEGLCNHYWVTGDTNNELFENMHYTTKMIYRVFKIYRPTFTISKVVKLDLFEGNTLYINK